MSYNGILKHPSKRITTLTKLCSFICASTILTSTALQANNWDPSLSHDELVKLSEKTEVWGSVPPVVSTQKGKAPSDAIVLFDGDDLDQFEALKGGVALWTVSGDVFTVAPGTGDIVTKQEFCDVQLHLEWRAPAPIGDMIGQQRNNSGVFFQQKYEVQILDNYHNPTYPNGQAASVYKQTIPLANAALPPGEWQTYDIIFTAPKFEGDEMISNGFVTVLHNGVLVQNHTKIQGTTEWIGPPKVTPHGCAPIQLQDHGNLVSFKNIWVRTL